MSRDEAEANPLKYCGLRKSKNGRPRSWNRDNRKRNIQSILNENEDKENQPTRKKRKYTRKNKPLSSSNKHNKPLKLNQKSLIHKLKHRKSSKQMMSNYITMESSLENDSKSTDPPTDHERSKITKVKENRNDLESRNVSKIASKKIQSSILSNSQILENSENVQIAEFVRSPTPDSLIHHHGKDENDEIDENQSNLSYIII